MLLPSNAYSVGCRELCHYVTYCLNCWPHAQKKLGYAFLDPEIFSPSISSVLNISLCSYDITWIVYVI